MNATSNIYPFEISLPQALEKIKHVFNERNWPKITNHVGSLLFGD
jgi:hypothetical protein